MRYALLLVAASTLLAQNLQTLTAQIQRTPTAALFVERGTAYLDAGDAKQAIADFKAGKQNAIGALIGQVMREVKGADPQTVREKIIAAMPQ